MNQKKLWFAVAMLAMLLTFAGCQAQTQDKADTATQEAVEPTAAQEEVVADAQDDVIRLRAIAPEGATTIAMLEMLHDQPNLGDNVEVTYESLNATDILSADLMGEKTDFAIAPTNLAAVLYNKGVPYSLVSVNTHGNLYMVTSEAISTWEDLKCQEVYMIGQGLVPDLIFRYLAEANGLVPDEDFTITYLSGSTEIAPMFLSGKAKIIIMPEPVLSVVSTKDVPYTVLFDFQKEYEAVTGLTGGYPQAGLLVRDALIEEHPEIVEAFITALEASCDWVNAEPEQAGAYIQDLDLGIPSPIVVKAMPGLNIWHQSVQDAKPSLEKMFQILYDASPSAIGGAMPDEAFYQYGN